MVLKYLTCSARIVPRYWSIDLLLLKELHDPVHLSSECVNHPLVLVYHSSDGQNLSKSLKSKNNKLLQLYIDQLVG